MTMFFDTHCHLNSESLIKDIDEVINRALFNHVTLMNVVGYDYASSKQVMELINKYPNLIGSIGIHPCDIGKCTKAQVDEMKTWLSHPRIKAVGEIGLDYYWVKDKQEQARQREAFINQIEVANQHKLPVVIHCREAVEDTYLILKDHRPLFGGVMHCYSGSCEMMVKFLDLGLHISLGGPVTFMNAKTPKEVAKIIPLDRLLLETDAPYLTPHPHRGKRNEPSYLIMIAEEIARIRNMTVAEIGTSTFNNGCKLFHVEHNDD